MRVEKAQLKGLAEQAATILGAPSTQVQVKCDGDSIEVSMLSGKRPKKIVGDVPEGKMEEIRVWAQKVLETRST